MKKNTVRRRFPQTGYRPTFRYGLITVTYARLSPSALVIGWSCAKLGGFGELTVRQNFTRHYNADVGINDQGLWVFTPAPGVHLDTEAMGPEFVGEVMKAFYWAQEQGVSIPEEIV